MHHVRLHLVEELLGEGVNLDDELVRMTVYQNSYAAASRIIQAADEMFRILLNLGR